MPKVHYYLLPSKSSEFYIRLTFNYPGGRLVFYPGEKIKPAQWNTASERVRKGTPGEDEINAGLNRLEGIVLDIYRRYRNEGRALPVDRFRDEVGQAWTGKIAAPPDRISLFEFWARLVEERKVSPNFARITWKTCLTALNKVRAFSKSDRYPVDFDRVNMDFHARFLAWMSARGYSPNYIHKTLATTKMVMREAAARELHTNMAFTSPKFTAKKFTPEKIYLDETEIAAIAALSLPVGGRLDKARDLFLIGAYTGLRFSDYSMLKPENIGTFDGVEMLTVQTRKTKTRISIPIMQEARALLDKNGGVPPAAISNQKLNDYIKQVCRMAGITEPVRIVSIRGGHRVEEVSEKCDLVSTHTARRSFASNEYLRALREGRAWRPIMDILGMNQEATFFRYVRVSSEVTAAAFAKGRGG